MRAHSIVRTHILILCSITLRLWIGLSPKFSLSLSLSLSAQTRPPPPLFLYVSPRSESSVGPLGSVIHGAEAHRSTALCLPYAHVHIGHRICTRTYRS
jgi:hypothetical protein